MRRIVAGLIACVFAAAAVVALAGEEDLLKPPSHSDGVDGNVGPLDLASVALGQQGTMFQLTLVTHRSWEAARLAAKGKRSLCVTLSYGSPSRPRSQLCVASRASRPVLLRSKLDSGGAAVGEATPVHAEVFRDNQRTLRASFTPLDADLPRGRFAWRVDARWPGAPGCPSDTVCVDGIPDAGTFASRAWLLAEPPCFGAAARDARHPCSNPSLERTAVPTPDEAVITPNAPCTTTGVRDLVIPCAFGVTPEQARSTMALVGDSHAGHWRGALEVVAQAHRWSGLSINRTSCPLNTVTAKLKSAVLTAHCGRWNREVREWLSRHRTVRTVFVSEDAYAQFAGGAVAGYRAAWRALPRSVRRIFVLRDTPTSTAGQADCVRRLLRAHRPIGARCAQSLANSLKADPAADAARSGADRRVHLIDLTSFMCGRSSCPAVVGGALVRKDGGHLTRLFSTTLGPFVLRAINRKL
jgi:hypothetical protein